MIKAECRWIRGLAAYKFDSCDRDGRCGSTPHGSATNKFNRALAYGPWVGVTPEFYPVSLKPGIHWIRNKMGQAKQRGTFEQRKAEAIAAGRMPEKRSRAQRALKQMKRIYVAELLDKLMNHR